MNMYSHSQGKSISLPNFLTKVYLMSVYYREYPNNPTYVVIINLNERNKTVDLEMLDNLKGKALNVAASASSSNYRIGYNFFLHIKIS